LNAQKARERAQNCGCANRFAPRTGFLVTRADLVEIDLTPIENQNRARYSDSRGGQTLILWRHEEVPSFNRSRRDIDGNASLTIEHT